MGNLQQLMQVLLLLACIAVVGCSASSSPTCEEVGLKLRKRHLQGEVMDVVRTGEDEEHFVILTSKRQVYTSHDGGRSWKHVKLRAGRKNHAIFTGVSVSPVDPRTVLLSTPDRRYARSHDSGRTFRLHNGPVAFHDIRPNPNSANLWLASGFSPSCFANSRTRGSHGDDASVCKRSLYFSRDNGKSWESALHYLVDYDWGSCKECVVVSMHREQKGHQFSLNQREILVVYTQDLFNHKRQIISAALGFRHVKNHLFVAAQDPGNSDGMHLYVSRHPADPLRRVKFPKDVPQRRYSVVDVVAHQSMISVEHSDGLGDLYVLEHSETEAVAVLHKVPRDRYGHASVTPIKGLNGGYIANVVSESLFGQQGAIRSVFSMDHGSHWEPLDKADNMHCASHGLCSTHVHHRRKFSAIDDVRSRRMYHVSDDSAFGPLVSDEVMPGFIVASGNVGDRLQTRNDLVDTLVSSNGGLNWAKMADGPHNYEIVNHGSIIAMAQSGHATQSLSFSKDMGKTTTKCQFYDKSIEVFDIFSERTSTAREAIIAGAAPEAVDGVLFFVDFSGLQKHACTGSNNADDTGSDFETWKPHAGPHSACFNGEAKHFVRKRADSDCYINPDQFKQKQAIRRCPCTVDDYECDFCFERTADSEGWTVLAPGQVWKQNTTAANGQCKLSCSAFEADKLQHPPKSCNGEYPVTQGYHKIEGNRCEGGLQLGPRMIKCDSSVTEVVKARVAKQKAALASGKGGGAGWLFVLFVIVAMVGGTAFAAQKGLIDFRNAGELKDKFKSLLPLHRNDVGGPAYSRLGQHEEDPFDPLAINYDALTPPDSPRSDDDMSFTIRS